MTRVTLATTICWLLTSCAAEHRPYDGDSEPGTSDGGGEWDAGGDTTDSDISPESDTDLDDVVRDADTDGSGDGLDDADLDGGSWRDGDPEDSDVEPDPDADIDPEEEPDADVDEVEEVCVIDEPFGGVAADCDPPSELDGYIRRTCRYERLHREGTMEIDVYEPLGGAAGAPVVLFAHGGGWITGSLRGGAIEAALGRWAREGNVGVSFEYELIPSVEVLGVPVPSEPITSRAEMAFEHDAAAAFAWTSAYISSFGGDPGHIVLMGHSAGGHIVTLLTAQRSWLRDALIDTGQLCESDADTFRPSQVVRGVVNLSGPTDLGRGRDFGPILSGLVEGAFSPEMRTLASPLHWLELEGDAPPLLFVAGGGENPLHGDPEAIWGSMRDYVVAAQALDEPRNPATFIQPLLEVRRHDLPWWLDHRNGRWCFAHLAHDDTARLLSADSVELLGDMGYSGEFAGVCNDLALAGTFASLPPFRPLIEGFLADPGGPVDWVTPAWGPLSVPDCAGAPLRFNVGGGVVHVDDGLCWSASPPSAPVPVPGCPDPTNPVCHGVSTISTREFDVTGVLDSEGHPVPEGVFHFQRSPFGHHPRSEVEVHTSVAPGCYRVRLYFGENWRERHVDIRIEGELLSESFFAGSPGAVRVYETDPLSVDAIFDLVLSRAAGGDPILVPRLAGLELVPADGEGACL